MKQRVLCLLGSIGVVLAMSTISAQGQIIGELEANIPFTFHAGGAKLPPGKYIIHVLDGSDLSTMEIESADTRTSALFEVREAQASTTPQKAVLVFNHYGNRYFLSNYLTGLTRWVAPLWTPAIQRNTHLVRRLLRRRMCRRAVRGTSHRLLRIAGFQRWGVAVAGNSSLSARYLRI